MKYANSVPFQKISKTKPLLLLKPGFNIYYWLCLQSFDMNGLLLVSLSAHKRPTPAILNNFPGDSSDTTMTKQASLTKNQNLCQVLHNACYLGRIEDEIDFALPTEWKLLQHSKPARVKPNWPSIQLTLARPLVQLKLVPLSYGSSMSYVTWPTGMQNSLFLP